jgi:hypothetical protein
MPLIAFALMEFHVAPRLFVTLSGYSSVIFGTLQLILAAWVLWMGARHQQPSPLKKNYRSKSTWQGLCRLAHSIYSPIFTESSAGLNSKLQYQLVIMTFIFVAHISAYGTLYCSVLHFFRLGIVIIFAFTRDQQTDFKALRRDPNGAGFGLVRMPFCETVASERVSIHRLCLLWTNLLLMAVGFQVVDACMLADALRLYLGNKPPLEHMPAYKATVYRMEATMAGRPLECNVSHISQASLQLHDVHFVLGI